MVKTTPSAAAAAGSPLSADDVAFIMTVLKDVESIQINWKSVAAKVGITRSDNATSKFNVILKKIGHKLVKGQIVSLDEAAPATPNKPTVVNDDANDAQSTGKKRNKKSASAGTVNDGEGSPAAKKAKIETA